MRTRKRHGAGGFAFARTYITLQNLHYITLHYITLHYITLQTDRQTGRHVCLHSYVPTNIHASHLHTCRHLPTYTCACVSCRAFPHSLCGPSACAGRRYEPEIAFTGWNFGQTEETGALAVTKIAVRSRSSGTPRRLSPVRAAFVIDSRAHTQTPSHLERLGLACRFARCP